MAFHTATEATFALYTLLLIAKVYAVTFLTVRARFSTGSFAHKEDLKGIKGVVPHAKLNTSNPDVERVRLLHLNDLENVPFFIFVAYLLVMGGAGQDIVKWHMQGFLIARVVHTLILALALPLRPLAFGAGVFFTMSAIYNVFLLL